MAASLLLVACGGGAPPAPSPMPDVPRAETAPAHPVEEQASGTVRVSASSLNIRGDASTAAAVVGHARRGERLALLAESGGWLRIRTADGTAGWVSSQHVVREGAAARPRRTGCPPDGDYSFVRAPKPSFSEGGPHGIVVIEASVDAAGNVTSTRVVSNDTGDAAIPAIAEREIRAAKFAPPMRNCTPRSFLFTYKRAF